MRKVKNEINSKHLHTYQNLLNFNDNKFKNHILFNSKNRNLRKKFIKYYYNKKKLYKTPNTKISYPINFFSNKKKLNCYFSYILMVTAQKKKYIF